VAMAAVKVMERRRCSAIAVTRHPVGKHSVLYPLFSLHPKRSPQSSLLHSPQPDPSYPCTIELHGGVLDPLKHQPGLVHGSILAIAAGSRQVNPKFTFFFQFPCAFLDFILGNSDGLDGAARSGFALRGTTRRNDSANRTIFLKHWNGSA
jgi:hypothetical protein